MCNHSFPQSIFSIENDYFEIKWWDVLMGKQNHLCCGSFLRVWVTNDSYHCQTFASICYSPKTKDLKFHFMNLHSGFMLPVDWFSMDFPSGSDGRNLPVLQKIQVWSLGREDSPGEGNGYPLQNSGLENSTDCKVHGVTKNWTQLSNFHFTGKHLRFDSRPLQ